MSSSQPRESWREVFQAEGMRRPSRNKLLLFRHRKEVSVRLERSEKEKLVDEAGGRQDPDHTGPC